MPDLKKILLITGPTRERIDSVRFISNYSSGKMGLAIANFALKTGMQVKIVSGPVDVLYPTGADVVYIESAEAMKSAALALLGEVDFVINCAAVCDYRPKTVFDRKLKKGSDFNLLEKIELEKTPDILKTICENKRDNQVIVGFCAETDNLLDSAEQKLLAKGCDIIVANDVSENRAFGKDESQGYIICTSSVEEFDCSKNELAAKILNKTNELFVEKLAKKVKINT